MLKMFQIHNYMVGEVIAKSTFSTIRYTRKESNDNEYISKCIAKKKAVGPILRNETILAPLLSQPNILPIREVFETQKMIIQITDLCKKGDLLSNILAGADIKPTLSIYQVLLAVNYLHKHFICHRDIKLENIMVGNDGLLKLADFGLAAITFTGLVIGKCGSYNYVAPEASDDKPYNGFKADVWSLGVLCYCILAKKFPYSDYKGMSNIDFSVIDDKWRPLVESMLSMSPEGRPTVQECLNNQVFTSLVPIYKQNEPFDISVPILDVHLNMISIVAQMCNTTAGVIREMMKEDKPNEAKLYVSLLIERDKKNQDGFLSGPMRFKSGPLPMIPRSITRQYSADSNDVIKEINNYVIKINGCVSMPTTKKRSIVLNTPGLTKSIAFTCAMYEDDVTEISFRPSKLNSLFIQDICTYLDSAFSKPESPKPISA